MKSQLINFVFLLLIFQGSFSLITAQSSKKKGENVTLFVMDFSRSAHYSPKFLDKNNKDFFGVQWDKPQTVTEIGRRQAYTYARWVKNLLFRFNIRPKLSEQLYFSSKTSSSIQTCEYIAKKMFFDENLKSRTQIFTMNKLSSGLTSSANEQVINIINKDAANDVFNFELTPHRCPGIKAYVWKKFNNLEEMNKLFKEYKINPKTFAKYIKFLTKDPRFATFRKEYYNKETKRYGTSIGNIPSTLIDFDLNRYFLHLNKFHKIPVNKEIVTETKMFQNLDTMLVNKFVNSNDLLPKLKGLPIFKLIQNLVKTRKDKILNGSYSGGPDGKYTEEAMQQLTNIKYVHFSFHETDLAAIKQFFNLEQNKVAKIFSDKTYNDFMSTLSVVAYLNASDNQVKLAFYSDYNYVDEFDFENAFVAKITNDFGPNWDSTDFNYKVQQFCSLGETYDPFAESVKEELTLDW